MTTEIQAHHYHYNLTACSTALRGAEPAAPDHTDSSAAHSEMKTDKHSLPIKHYKHHKTPTNICKLK